MNCTINTLSPCPTARKAVPKAAVVLPFPGPVLTMINPFLVSGKRASKSRELIPSPCSTAHRDSRGGS